MAPARPLPLEAGGTASRWRGPAGPPIRENPMRDIATAVAASAALLTCAPALAQVPYIEGVWTLNPAKSHLPGPPPKSEVRTYRMGPNGVFTGLAVGVAPGGAPYFLMFSGKPDGRDHPEFDTQSAAR